MAEKKQYIAIDLKSFYASVECVERGLNALDTCLVVADESRTDKTICLAVSPALKAYGVSGRPRLFEVRQIVRDLNSRRGNLGRSISAKVLGDPRIAIDYIIARPRMQLYIDYSSRIYEIYLRHIAPEDIYVYSVDEVFIDATSYLKPLGISAHSLAMRIIGDVLARTGITATAGIGTNMYLCKVAMDIMAKKQPANADGVRVAELDETVYRRALWDHSPLTDFWRVGRGTARRLAAVGIATMGELARRSLTDQQWFYDEFGADAELLIDHAWGCEPVEMADVRDYSSEHYSMSTGQVLPRPYTWCEARNVVKEMADSESLEMVEKGLVMQRMTLTVGYDSENLNSGTHRDVYVESVRTDRYGRQVPYHSHGTANFECYTSSSREIVNKATELFEKIANPKLTVRRLTICFEDLVAEVSVSSEPTVVPYDLFADYDEIEKQKAAERCAIERERRRQKAVLGLRSRFGKNVILKGLNFGNGATQIERNVQIGGHKA